MMTREVRGAKYATVEYRWMRKLDSPEFRALPLRARIAFRLRCLADRLEDDGGWWSIAIRINTRARALEAREIVDGLAFGMVETQRYFSDAIQETVESPVVAGEKRGAGWP